MTAKDLHKRRVYTSTGEGDPHDLSLLALVCKLDNRKVGIELRFVDEVFQAGYVTPIPRAPECFAGLTNLRGRVIVLIDPAQILFSSSPTRALPGRTAVLVSWRNIRAGLLVGHIEDVTSAGSRFEPAPETSLMAGTIETAAGPVELVHVERLLREAMSRSTAVGAELTRQVAQ